MRKKWSHVALLFTNEDMPLKPQQHNNKKGLKFYDKLNGSISLELKFIGKLAKSLDISSAFAD